MNHMIIKSSKFLYMPCEQSFNQVGSAYNIRMIPPYKDIKMIVLKSCLNILYVGVNILQGFNTGSLFAVLKECYLSKWRDFLI